MPLVQSIGWPWASLHPGTLRKHLMKITREFIEQHKTSRGGWRNVQIQALGQSLPPVSGWIDRAIAADHTQEALDRFIASGQRRLSKAERVLIRAEARQQKRAGKVAALQDKLAAGAAAAKAKRPPKASRSFATAPDFLSSFAWRQLRMQVLQKYGRVCMCCGASPATGAVMHVDHIKPRRLFPQLALDIDNLQVLCHECNHGKGNWDQTDWRPHDDKIDPDVSAWLRSIAREPD